MREIFQFFAFPFISVIISILKHTWKPNIDGKNGLSDDLFDSDKKKQIEEELAKQWDVRSARPRG